MSNLHLFSRAVDVVLDAILGIGVGVAVHAAVTLLPAAAVSYASPLLLLLMVLVILSPAAFLRGPWPRTTAFVVAYGVALLASGLPAAFIPGGVS